MLQSMGRKESDRAEQLNNENNLKIKASQLLSFSSRAYKADPISDSNKGPSKAVS